ncbi:MAG TPA: uroporphyrinogen-III synthase [Nitrososphaera sp.]|nr:uroporphyrinogen-III synthase [Nitrososphaera sp.]
MSGFQNKTLAITRSEQDAAEFLAVVEAEGGTGIALPAIEVVPKGPAAIHEFLTKMRKNKYDYCAFMSPHAVSILLENAGTEVSDVLKSTTVIAVGPKTKERLVEKGVEVRMMPSSFSSAGLTELLSTLNPQKKRIIIPRSGAANESAAKSLQNLGMQVDQVLLYTVRPAIPTPVWSEFSRLLTDKKVNAIIFTSASNVKSFFDIMGKMELPELRLNDLTKVISIGPLTSKELKSRNITYFEAVEHTVAGALKVAREVA